MNFELTAPIRQEFPALAAHWAQIKPKFQKRQVPAQTTLLNEGEIATQLYLVIQGSLRMWHNTPEREVTLQFFFENQPVTSFESFYLDQPSDSTIATLENSTLLVLSKKDFTAFCQAYPDVEVNLNQWLCQRFITYRRRIYAQLQTTATGRYQALIADNPEILTRIPLHEIASYLGITPVSLSRIRAQLDSAIAKG